MHLQYILQANSPTKDCYATFLESSGLEDRVKRTTKCSFLIVQEIESITDLILCPNSYIAESISPLLSSKLNIASFLRMHRMETSSWI